MGVVLFILSGRRYADYMALLRALNANLGVGQKDTLQKKRPTKYLEMFEIYNLIIIK